METILKEKNKVYFENLDALRFLAFLAVFFEHIAFDNLVKTDNPAYINLEFGFLYRGYLGVGLFFVLSGFLISYLLIQEKENKGKINIKNFYIRRILRIWPLYFMVLIIGFILMPILDSNLQNDVSKSLYYLLFAANFNWINYGDTINHVLVPMWSISIEEQFYLVFPLVLFFVPSKHILKVIIAVIIVSIIFRFYASIHFTNRLKDLVMGMHTLSVMVDIAVGAALGYISYYKTDLINRFSKLDKTTIILAYIVGLSILFLPEFDYGNHTQSISRFTYAIFFGFVIMEQTWCDNSIIKVSKIPYITWLGTISYGLYCFHQPALLITKWLTKFIPIENNWVLSFILIAIIGLVITITISTISYRFIETPILKLKKKFSN